MTVQRLDVGEDAHGIWLVTHHHHVFHFYQTVTVSHFPVLTIKQIQQIKSYVTASQDSFDALSTFETSKKS